MSAANLAVVHVAVPQRPSHGSFELSSGQHDGGRFPSEFEYRPGDVVRDGSQDFLARAHRPGKGQDVYAGVCGQRGPAFAPVPITTLNTPGGRGKVEMSSVSL